MTKGGRSGIGRFSLDVIMLHNTRRLNWVVVSAASPTAETAFPNQRERLHFQHAAADAIPS